jgi:phosphonate transport system permease protein
MTQAPADWIEPDLADLTRRYPAIMTPSPRGKIIAVISVLGALALLVFSAWWLELRFDRVLTGISQLGLFSWLMVPPSAGGHALLYFKALGETLAIALLGTLIGAILAFPFGLLAAANVIPSWIFRFGLRRSMDTLRSVDTLVWALIWINVVGLGPFAGVLAIASSDFGAFGKLFAETLEGASGKGAEGIRSTGGTRLQELRFGLLPEVLPVMLGTVLYYFESNTRSATIIGIVGAGGIGLHLYEEIRTVEWQHVSFIIVLILVTVAIIDFISSKLRGAIAGRKASGQFS